MAAAEILKGRWGGCLRVRKCDCKMLVRETTVFMLRALNKDALLYLHRGRRVISNARLIITELCDWGVRRLCTLHYNQLCTWAKTLLPPIILLRIPKAVGERL